MIDFLIVGTFKSASSTIAYELGKHPRIDIPKPKDPYFYLAQMCKGLIGPDGFVEEQDAYSVYDRATFEALFRHDGVPRLKGEATPMYLYCHEHAIPAIQADNPDTRIIMLLRNPIDRAYSNYMHNVKDGYETRSFAECISSWEETEHLPLHPFFHYVRAGFYFEQVAAYTRAFNRVKIVDYDDVKRDPSGVLNEIATFLGIEPSFLPHKAIRLNKSGSPRSHLLHEFIRRESLLKKAARPLFRTIVRDASKRIALSEFVKNFNIKTAEMARADRAALASIYHNDVALLTSRLGIDFARNWRL